MPSRTRERSRRYRQGITSSSFPLRFSFQVQRCRLQQVLEGGQVQVSVDGVPWVIKPGDYMSSFSFLRALVSTKVLVSDQVLTLAKVLTMGGWGGGGGQKIFKD